MDIQNNNQSGFSLIEAAYVLPLVMILILALVEAVNYASDRYYLNNTLTDFYAVVMTEAQQQASDPNYTSQLVFCDAGHVRVHEAEAASMLRQMVLGVTGASPQTLEIATEKRNMMGVETYIVDVSMPMRTRFLPQGFAQVFPLKSKMIISFALTCQTA